MTETNSETLGETIYQQREEVVDRMAVSAFPAELSAGDLFLPNRLEGKKVLDIATGCSDMVVWLSQQGADAYGVDIGFGDMPGLLAQLDRFNGQMLRADSDFRGMLLFMVESGLARAKFEKDLVNSPGRYIAADAGLLPFTDGVFDLVTGHNFYTSEVCLHRELLTWYLNEALRVLKPGGNLHVSTLTSDLSACGRADVEYPVMKGNIDAALDDLAKRGLTDKVRRMQLPGKAWAFILTKSRSACR
jgi:ubiquinone/menaquinone biosynthesis C-methylase UbiE